MARKKQKKDFFDQAGNMATGLAGLGVSTAVGAGIAEIGRASCRERV